MAVIDEPVLPAQPQPGGARPETERRTAGRAGILFLLEVKINN